MPQVTVTIAGRSYRMACGEGEEAHLEALAALYDGKIQEMRGSFGEIGDMRLHVMAALTLADDLAETRRRMAALEEEIAALRTLAAAGNERSQALEGQLAEVLVKTAERIERLAKSLNLSVQAAQPACAPRPRCDRRGLRPGVSGSRRSAFARGGRPGRPAGISPACSIASRSCRSTPSTCWRGPITCRSTRVSGPTIRRCSTAPLTAASAGACSS